MSKTKEDRITDIQEACDFVETALDAIDTAASADGVQKDEAADLARAETLLQGVLESLTNRRDELES